MYSLSRGDGLVLRVSNTTTKVYSTYSLVLIVRRSPLEHYRLDHAAALAQHAAQYCSMRVQMSADNLEDLFNMIMRHVSTLVRFQLLLSHR